MAIEVKEVDGHDIQDATYASKLLQGKPTRQRRIKPVFTKPIAGPVRIARAAAMEQVIPLEIDVLSATTSNIEQLMKWFRPGTVGPLIVDFDGVRRTLQVMKKHSFKVIQNRITWLVVRKPSLKNPDVVVRKCVEFWKGLAPIADDSLPAILERP